MLSESERRMDDLYVFVHATYEHNYSKQMQYAEHNLLKHWTYNCLNFREVTLLFILPTCIIICIAFATFKVQLICLNW